MRARIVIIPAILLSLTLWAGCGPVRVALRWLATPTPTPTPTPTITPTATATPTPTPTPTPDIIYQGDGLTIRPLPNDAVQVDDETFGWRTVFPQSWLALPDDNAFVTDIFNSLRAEGDPDINTMVDTLDSLRRTMSYRVMAAYMPAFFARRQAGLVITTLPVPLLEDELADMLPIVAESQAQILETMGAQDLEYWQEDPQTNPNGVTFYPLVLAYRILGRQAVQISFLFRTGTGDTGMVQYFIIGATDLDTLSAYLEDEDFAIPIMQLEVITPAQPNDRAQSTFRIRPAPEIAARPRPVRP